MADYIKYIIGFLLGNTLSGEDSDLYIGYTNNSEEFHKYKLVIIPSGFFDEKTYGKPCSIPKLPLKTIDNVPLLFGVPEVIEQNNQLIIKADIIASAYFLLSRYEEFIQKDVRDAHGRFQGKESLPYKANFINRPIVDEYGFLLKKWLKQVGALLPETSPRINKIYLTHDIDVPFYYRSVKSFVKGIFYAKDKKTVINSFFGNIEKNPAYTYSWFIEQNNKLQAQLKNSLYQSVFFFKAGGKAKKDRPFYNLHSKDIQALFTLCRENNIAVGLHTSYQAGIHSELIMREKKRLEAVVKNNVNLNRNHFLCSREPKDLIHIINAGITDDFTMGYADVSGFRLGTCRPVLWINPNDKKIYPLMLHPLVIMECTLDRKEYMNLDYNSAMAYCKDLIDQTANFNGDLVLLWHNTSFINSCGGYQKKLYQSLLDYIKNLDLSHQ